MLINDRWRDGSVLTLDQHRSCMFMNNNIINGQVILPISVIVLLFSITAKIYLFSYFLQGLTAATPAEQDNRYDFNIRNYYCLSSLFQNNKCPIHYVLSILPYRWSIDQLQNIIFIVIRFWPANFSTTWNVRILYILYFILHSLQKRLVNFGKEYL